MTVSEEQDLKRICLNEIEDLRSCLCKLDKSRSLELSITKLDECFMWLLADLEGKYSQKGVIMAIFGNPYDGKLDNLNYYDQFLQAMRIDLAGELEAQFLYQAHLMILDPDSYQYKVLDDILREEKVHAEEIQYIIARMQDEGVAIRREAVQEVKDFIEGKEPERKIG